MKIFKFLAVALVAMLGFTACEKDCDHDFIEHDHSADLVGTWTCHQPNVSAAMEIKADGSVIATTLANDEYSENVPGKIEVENNKVCLTLEDGTIFKGLLEITPSETFVIVDEERGLRLTHRLCKQDLSKEIVGMWVCNDSKMDAQNDMMIQIFDANGKTTLTGFLPMEDNPEFVLNDKTDYKVVGDLMFLAIPASFVGGDKPKYIAERLIYTPKATALGDVMTFTNYSDDNNELLSESWLRIKQYLELPGTKYDYIKTFVTNVKGEDKDIPFLNTSFNFAKMDGSIIDKFLKSILFTVEFPEANKIKYSYLLEGKNIVIDAPIEVDGNKMTIKMSANNPAYQDVDMYAFQDQDNTQMHWYMPTTSFEKFFGNTSVALMLGYGQLDKDDTEGIANVYKTIADAVESINLSIVMSQSK